MSFFNSAKAKASEFKETAKKATLLTAKQAERTKLIQWDLPGAHAALGRNLYQRGGLPDALKNFVSKIDAIDQEIRRIESDGTSRPKAQGFVEQAKATAHGIKDAAHVKMLQVKARGAYAELGKAAYEQNPEQIAVPELMTPIRECLARLASLDADIALLSQATPGKWVTPKRLIVAACICAVLIIASLGKSRQEAGVVGNLADQQPGPKSQAISATIQRDIDAHDNDPPSHNENVAAHTRPATPDVPFDPLNPVLVAAFFPLCKSVSGSGQEQVYLTNGMTTESSIRYTRNEDNEGTTQKTVLLEGMKPIVQHNSYRINGNYVESKDEGDYSPWEPFLKIGAKPGEQWEAVHFDGKMTAKYQFIRIATDDSGVQSAIVICTSISSGSSSPIVIETTSRYELGNGLAGQVVRLKIGAAGQMRESRKWAVAYVK